jgi:hypothetical protein
MRASILDATLGVHVAAGVLALLAGALALGTAKGGRRHRRAGRAYVASMAVVVVTAIPLALADGNYFLFTVAVFSGYLVLNGYRVLSRKRPVPGEAAPLDWAAHLSMVGVGVAMVGLGGRSLLGGDGPGVVLVVFGGIGLVLAGREIRAVYRPPESPREWFYRHLAFMGGGYIATVTAAVTVNLGMLPPLVRWVGPTAVGTPAIVLAVLWYRREFGDGSGRTFGG